jgi:leucyl aminopeptidase
VIKVAATTAAPVETDADTVAIGVFEDKDVSHDLDGAPLQALLDAGEARRSFGHLALTHAAGKRWLVVGLGPRDAFDAEQARSAAATVVGRAQELGTRALCWELPHRLDDAQVEAFVEGTLLGAYRFDAFKAAPAEEAAPLERLIVSDHSDRSGPAARAAVVAEAQNRARDLANTPPNVLTPTALAQRARALADEHAALSVEIAGRAEIADRGMGAFAAVAAGAGEEPALITLRYEPRPGDRYALGLVGKAVTFDSGGLWIKPAQSMPAMKFDMAGGGAVLEAMGAIAALQLPLRVIAVIGATENLIDAHAMRPGDVVRTLEGTTVEIVNPDAEGRLVLADCLTHALACGAQRLVDVATLTGAILSALGRAYGGLFADDDAWADLVARAGQRTGERVWRMPLDPSYARLLESQSADVVNSGERGVAGAAVAAQFLSRFSGDVPWAHLDMVGTGWDLGRPYAAKGASGWGVRLLVEVASVLAAQ